VLTAPTRAGDTSVTVQASDQEVKYEVRHRRSSSTHDLRARYPGHRSSSSPPSVTRLDKFDIAVRTAVAVEGVNTQEEVVK